MALAGKQWIALVPRAEHRRSQARQPLGQGKRYALENRLGGDIRPITKLEECIACPVHFDDDVRAYPERARQLERRPTLKDVAERAGVSIGTASNAFNRPDVLSDALRQRVLDEARTLGYGGPDPAGRRLRTGRAGALGLIFTDRLPFAFDDEAAVIFLRGVASALETTGDGLLLIPTSPTRREGARVVRESAVDGFLVYSTPTGDPRLEAALERGLPTVVVDEPLEVPVPYIGVEDRKGARDAARHLVELGHERVAVVAFPEHALDDHTLPFDATAERLTGYREGLGAAWDPALVFTARGNRPETGRQGLRELLSVASPPTAVLAMSDALASGVLREAAEQHLQVPGELSVIGFDDVPLAELTEPPLTTVNQPTEHKGELAARALLDAIQTEARSEPRRTVLPTKLVLRGTTAPPP
ncbi:MAG TPA: LacI family DNA-binding transcriptional regulator [Thermoleophilaceae bacterium]|nr:LacI family DNA-binding transcriptional regulator [Thermoleophilaceae bacterium]